MKPTRDTAYLTIATSIIGALIQILMLPMQNLLFKFPDNFKYLIYFIPLLCFIWLVVFMMGIIKYTHEKPFVFNAFIIYSIFSPLHGVASITMSFFHIPVQSLLMFYQVTAIIKLLIIIGLIVATFNLSPTQFRSPLRFFALSELFIMLFYIVMPPLLTLTGGTNYGEYMKYLSLINLIIPAAGIYIAVTALNVINKQQWQKPFCEMDKPDWPPYDKPGL